MNAWEELFNFSVENTYTEPGFSVENTYTEPGSRFTVTKFRQVGASRGARIGGVEWAVSMQNCRSDSSE
jgi:hypothetical protein